MVKIYISGKITGLSPEIAEANFARAEERLAKLGFDVVNPMTLVPYDPVLTWHDYMAKDIEALLYCDAVYMLPNWADSRGANIEHYIGATMGLHIAYEPCEDATLVAIRSCVNYQKRLETSDDLPF